MNVGWVGVDLFFVLSGFLVSGLLFSDYQKLGRIRVSHFYIRRGLKIWPAFFVLIATGLLIDLMSGPAFLIPKRRLLSELVFMQSYFPGLWNHTWSLAVEEHFYLSLPVLLLLMIRRKSESPFAAIPYVFAAIAVFSLACRFAVGWKENGTSNFLTYYFPTHLRMDSLMFGVLLSYYKRFRPDVFNRLASWRGGWIVIAVALVSLSRFPVEDRNMHTWGFTLMYIGAGFLVAKAVAFQGSAPIRVMSNLLASIGGYSYSIYLWHMFYQLRVLSHFQITSFTLWAVCYIPGSILFGIVAAKAIEFPVLRFRDRVFPSSSTLRVDSNDHLPAVELVTT
jgi:peptidoglycan/LPS O-acetylase OafA/YrhL